MKNNSDIKSNLQNVKHWINELIQKLESVKPMELLKTNKARANYFLVKEAKIIAMTSTYAAIKVLLFYFILFYFIFREKNL